MTNRPTFLEQIKIIASFAPDAFRELDRDESMSFGGASANARIAYTAGGEVLVITDDEGNGPFYRLMGATESGEPWESEISGAVII